ncbi:LOW QUALITY PROTEIN: putative metallophosphoesterase At3g03305 [Dioscorea cayenensis subsp. rotundata]|uniref:LOW QUALITY PROTEIN: putative metallophosphoesterase At3g03305 n=1 Tax=Dioscorea cayennensis subsp. rotundata TaxID=55577 RepID=A0AB40AXS6_DIOCR|nr:LOW QUALITY PROTEIN: putative metallophosphoesterase At3g03305 [Dioscorea cayenensis subsp. rotundata]
MAEASLYFRHCWISLSPLIHPSLGFSAQAMDLGRRWAFLLLVLLSSSMAFAASSEQIPGRAVIDVKGEPGSVVWVVQLSDLHFSFFHPERALDFKRLIGPALSMINPSLVLITGDLTEGKSKDLLIMKQNESEWIEYHDVITDVIKESGLSKNIFYDLRGNHDNFAVPVPGGTYDFYEKYSVNAMLGRKGNVQSVTLEHNEWKHLFVGFDSKQEIGLCGPTNLFGHPTDQLLTDLDMELSQWDTKITKSSLTKISFGHFPLSFSALSESGKSLKSVFLKHSLSAYLCGHLHTSFGSNLKRHHQSSNHSVSSSEYYQLNMHQASTSNLDVANCSNEVERPEEFWEWEMGDWRKSRAMRILAIDSGHVSFVDINFRSGEPKEIIILPTFPLDSRFMQRISSQLDYQCQLLKTSCYDTVRVLIFSSAEITSVTAKIYDSKPGNLHVVLDSTMKKLAGNGTRGDIYSVPWNWRAFVDESPDRYWLQIEAIDITGRSTSSELRPFSINGITKTVSWKWKEFLVMGCQWVSIYNPALSSVLLLLFSLLLIPQVFCIFSKKHNIQKSLSPSFAGKNVVELLIGGACWILMELSRMTLIWSGILLYLLFLTFLPWFFGHVFSGNDDMAYMTREGWKVKTFDERKQLYLGVPDVMVVVLPHLCFVVLPTVLVIASMAAEKAACRSYYLSLSGKKKDDNFEVNRRRSKFADSCRILRFLRKRWMRKLLLLACVVILWKHWKSCRALVKAYDMNPLLHAPVYCFFVPVILIYAVYKTSTAYTKSMNS